MSDITVMRCNRKAVAGLRFVVRRALQRHGARGRIDRQQSRITATKAVGQCCKIICISCHCGVDHRARHCILRHRTSRARGKHWSIIIEVSDRNKNPLTGCSGTISGNNIKVVTVFGLVVGSDVQGHLSRRAVDSQRTYICSCKRI